MAFTKNIDGSSVLTGLSGAPGTEVKLKARETDVLIFMKTTDCGEMRVVEIAERLFPNQSKDVFLYMVLEKLKDLGLMKREDRYVEIRGQKIKQVYWTRSDELCSLNLNG